MRPKLSSATLFFVLLILITGLVAGCGGGDQAQQGGGNGAAEKQGGEAGKQDGEAGNEKQRKASKPKIALGRIVNVIDEREKFVLREMRGERLVFKLGQQAEVRLNDKEADFQDMKEGQQAQVEYVVIEGSKVPNRARTVELFSPGEGKEPNGG